MSREMSLAKALFLMGLSETESKILAQILEHDNVTAEELIKETGLSRGTVYTALSKLTEGNYVIKSAVTRPIRYSATPYSLENIKEQLSIVYKSIMSEIKGKVIKDTREIMQEICTVFEKNGYAIKEPPRILRTDLVRRIAIPLIDKIAEGDYTIGIALLDKNKRLLQAPERFRYEFIYRALLDVSRELNCLTTFIFVHSDLKRFEEIYRSLTKLSETPHPWFRRECYSIADRVFYIFKTTENLTDRITKSIWEIRQRRVIINNIALTLRDKINQIQEVILLSQGHSRAIDNTMSGRAFPIKLDKFILERFEKIAEPVQCIKNRENRNLGIFRRRFSEDEVRINNYLDAFERRIYLPTVNALEKDIAELEMLLSKFTPIEFELNDLASGLFNYTIKLIEANRRKAETAINPFLFTEPYELDNFFVNEDSLLKAATELCNVIKEGLPSFFQIITGEAGMGKTHALKYIYGPIMEKEGIKPIYIDCPLNYDLLAGVFQELTQESVFPETVSGTIHALRRQTPSTPRELVEIIKEVASIWISLGFKGVLLILDELENSLPYAYLEEAKDIGDYQDPLALRQLREILSSRPIENLGLILSCRDKIYPLFKRTIKIENLDKFTYMPETLSITQVKDLIKHRYQMWSVIDGPEFEDEAIRKIIEAVHGNTRDIIKYCRELFKFTVRNQLKIVRSETVDKIGSIPLFRY